MLMKPPRSCFSAKRRTTKNHRPKNTTAGTTHDNQVAQEGAFDHPRVRHAVLRQARGQVGFDASGGEHGLALGVRAVQLAGEGAVGHHDFGHAPFGQGLFKLAVGHGLDLLRGLPPVVQQ